MTLFRPNCEFKGKHSHCSISLCQKQLQVLQGSVATLFRRSWKIILTYFVANLSKTLHISFYQKRSSIVEVMIKNLWCVFYAAQCIYSCVCQTVALSMLFIHNQYACCPLLHDRSRLLSASFMYACESISIVVCIRNIAVSSVRSTTFDPNLYRRRTLSATSNARLYYRIIRVSTQCYAIFSIIISGGYM